MSATPLDWNAYDGIRISVEHGWLCIREETGWLLWHAKIADMPDSGLLLEDVLRLAMSIKADHDKERAADAA